PHLTDANHRDWLVAAAGKSKKEVEKLVAAWRPKPDVPSSVRRLPNRRTASNDCEKPDVETGADVESTADPSNRTQACSLRDVAIAHDTIQQSDVAIDANQPGAVGLGARQPSAPGLGVGAKPGVNAIVPSNTAFGSNRPSEADSRAADRPRVQPLSESRYRIVFTASEALKQKLDRARELCSHCVAPTDLPALIERALDLLIEREEKRRFAVRSPKPRASRSEQDTVPQRETVPQRALDPVAIIANELPSTPPSALGPNWNRIQLRPLSATNNHPSGGQLMGPRKSRNPLNLACRVALKSVQCARVPCRLPCNAQSGSATAANAVSSMTKAIVAPNAVSSRSITWLPLRAAGSRRSPTAVCFVEATICTMRSASSDPPS
ncbi:MAG TPA: hypothetical protein VIV60_03715, partial [Polyangiaceae bacterium]